MTTEATAAAGKPPPGLESNSQSLYPQMVATVVLCSSLSTLFTAARLFTSWMVTSWALEDRTEIRAFC